MKQVSVENAFSWTQAFATREWPLLLPVGIAFFALPGLLVDVFLPHAVQALMPGATIDAGTQLGALAALIAIALVNMLGALAITTLALVPGISVQEAIGRALRRAPTLIGALLLVTAALLAVVVVVALALGAARADPVTMQNVLMLLIAVGGGALWVRLALLTPVVVERGGRPVAALRRAWALGHGVFWRLLGALAVYFIGGIIVLIAFSSALGAIVTLAARAMDAAPVGLVIAAILFRTLAAIVSTGFQLLVASLYRQLANTGN